MASILDCNYNEMNGDTFKKKDKLIEDYVSASFKIYSDVLTFCNIFS